MKQERPEYIPVKGRTYSLFGDAVSTLEYYKTTRALADSILAIFPDRRRAIEIIAGFSSKRRALKRILKDSETGSDISIILNLINPVLRKFTESTEDHLKSIAFVKRWDKTLSTTREQYHLYMMEIELTNRLFSDEFKKADCKVALLPYCLQDFSVSCLSAKKGFDYQCRGCSKSCFQNRASEILRRYDIEPYIWMGGNLKKLAGTLAVEKKTLGVLGIACIPELTSGIRTCRKNNIAVVGIPLNGNRCIRWFGEFFQNNIDLTELERLAGCTPT